MEIIFQNQTAAAKIARQLVMASQIKVYQDGKKPTLARIEQTANDAANLFLSEIHQAIEDEIRTLKQIVIE